MLFAGGPKGLALNVERLTLEVIDVVDGDHAGAGVAIHDDPVPTVDSAVVAHNR